MLLLEFTILNTGLVSTNTLDDKYSIRFRITFRSHGAVRHPPENEYRPETSNTSEKNKEKLPGFEGRGMDMAHSICEKAANDSLDSVLKKVY